MIWNGLDWQIVFWHIVTKIQFNSEFRILNHQFGKTLVVLAYYFKFQ